jgi:hypothetical protein
MSDEFHPIKLRPYGRWTHVAWRPFGPSLPNLKIVMSGGAELTSWRKSDAIDLSATRDRITFPLVLVSHRMTVWFHDPLARMSLSGETSKSSTTSA